jgi:hypothetical protein
LKTSSINRHRIGSKKAWAQGARWCSKCRNYMRLGCCWYLEMDKVEVCLPWPFEILVVDLPSIVRTPLLSFAAPALQCSFSRPVAAVVPQAVEYR